MAGVITQAASGVQRAPRASRHVGNARHAVGSRAQEDAERGRVIGQPPGQMGRERWAMEHGAREGGEQELANSWPAGRAGHGQGDRGRELCEVERCGWSAGSSAASHEGWRIRCGEREDLRPIGRTGIEELLAGKKTSR